MKTNLLVLFLTVSLGTFAIATPENDRAPNAGKPKWEYRVLGLHQLKRGTLESGLNELGEEGWELVDVEISIKGGQSNAPTYYFKRRKE